ncbi:MAG: glyoxylase-like metal-dependent hydrolase (beta-lactamase superfamily II) [Flammeovirgaceae bacterium]|jgi:hydroxyacylglutathione hydrolase
MLVIHPFTFNAFSENTYIISDSETKECIIIDPGCYDSAEQMELTEYISSENLKVTKIVNTHCHIDHVLGNHFCKEKFKVKLAVPKGETEVLRAVSTYSDNYGFAKYASTEPDELLENSGKIQVGNSKLEILYVPGHSPGHLAFYSSEQNFCINGDVLFHGSIGRTDLPGGNMNTLLASIRNVMFQLPDSTIVYCGHGPSTTIAFEKQNNPFCGVRK